MKTDIDYFKRTEVSNSDLSKLKAYLTGSEQPEPVDAYRLGTLVDLFITEPEKVDALQLTAGGYIYTQAEFDNVVKMKRAFMEDTQCRILYENAEFQTVMVNPGQWFEFGKLRYQLDTRCKWDLWNPYWKWGGDIKSTVATTEKEFIEACSYFDYDRQRAWYMDIAGSDRDIIIGISKKNHKVFRLGIKRGDAFYNSGKEKYEYLAFEYFKLYRQ
jgi:hypothetical protein